MAAADHGGPGPDLYQLLGVSRDASQEEIAQAWGRRARDEHPDARPADADAPGRFRALAEAYEMLANPGRRTAYDRSLARDQRPGVRVQVQVRRPPGSGRPDGVTPLAGAPGPPLRAGPVRVEGPRPAPPGADWDAQDIRLVVLAQLALRYLAADRTLTR